MNLDRVNALRCAILVLAGEAGGYSPEDLYRHKQTLSDMLAEEEKKED